MITVDRGTEDAPKIEMIKNPMPAWKRAGFDSRAEMEELAGIGRKKMMAAVTENCSVHVMSTLGQS